MRRRLALPRLLPRRLTAWLGALLGRYSLRPVTIRARLALSIALVLVVTLGGLGIVVARVARVTLITQLDDQVLGAAAQGEPRRPPPGGPPGYGPAGVPPGYVFPWLGPPGGGPPGGGPPAGGSGRPGSGVAAKPGGPPGGGPPGNGPPAPPPLPVEQEDRSGRLVGMWVYASDGTSILDAPSGVAGRPDPPPRVPAIPSAEAEAWFERLVDAPAIDGPLMYRVLLRRGPRGEVMVVAGSMRMVDAAVARIVQALVIAGLIALPAATLASVLLIRRGLAPVSRMIDTAAGIAAGDLTRRVPDLDPASELGRLGAALNEMLTQIERGIKARLENEERLRQFVADAAHELRTPLTSLLGYAELYRSGACPDAGAVDAVMRRIAAEGARMGRLVDDLLLLARLDHQQGIEYERVDVVAIVRDAVADFQVVQPDRPLTVDLGDLGGSGVVLGDRGRLHQVVDNLLANARTHTPPGTPVHVSTRRENGHLDLTVADEGPGILQDDQPRIFERFWRGDPSRVRRTGGTGLGLAIVASLVQAHGGSIALASEPGRGAAFTVRLPLAQ